MIYDLEIKYQEASHRAALTVTDENARRIHVGSHKLRDEIALLKEQAAGKEDRIRCLDSIVHQVRSRIDGAEENRRRQERLIQAQARDISKLKASAVLRTFHTVMG